MTIPSPMTREELLELASLDAFGLLDDYEAALFTRSFHHAPAAVQDEVKQLQASFAGDPTFLPDVEPPADLRRRVLHAVSSAVERESVDLAPLAMIGRMRDRPARAGYRPRVSASAQFWRAAAFVLAAGNLALAYVGIQLYRDSFQIAKAVLQADDLQAAKAQIGGSFYDDYVNQPNSPRLWRIVLAPLDRQPISAVVYVKDETDEDTGEPAYSLYLRTEALEVKSGFTLVARDASGVRLRHEFTTSVNTSAADRITSLPVEVARASRTLTWELLDAKGAIVLRA